MNSSRRRLDSCPRRTDRVRGRLRRSHAPRQRMRRRINFSRRRLDSCRRRTDRGRGRLRCSHAPLQRMRQRMNSSRRRLDSCRRRTDRGRGRLRCSHAPLQRMRRRMKSGRARVRRSPSSRVCYRESHPMALGQGALSIESGCLSGSIVIVRTHARHAVRCSTARVRPRRTACRGHPEWPSLAMHKQPAPIQTPWRRPGTQKPRTAH
jgi:hypothetical protein